MYKKHLTLLNSLIGKKFFRLKVLKFSHWHFDGKRRRPYVECKCSCGKIVKVRMATIRRTFSCGCYQIEKMKEAPQVLTSRKRKELVFELFKSGLGYTARQIAEMANYDYSHVCQILKDKYGPAKERRKANFRPQSD